MPNKRAINTTINCVPQLRSINYSQIAFINIIKFSQIKVDFSQWLLVGYVDHFLYFVFFVILRFEFNITISSAPEFICLIRWFEKLCLYAHMAWLKSMSYNSFV